MKEWEDLFPKGSAQDWYPPTNRILNGLLNAIKPINEFLTEEELSKDEIWGKANWVQNHELAYSEMHRAANQEHLFEELYTVRAIRLLAACSACVWEGFFRTHFEELLFECPSGKLVERLATLSKSHENHEHESFDRQILEGLAELIDAYGLAQKYIGDYWAATNNEERTIHLLKDLRQREVLSEGRAKGTAERKKAAKENQLDLDRAIRSYLEEPAHLLKSNEQIAGFIFNRRGNLKRPYKRSTILNHVKRIAADARKRAKANQA